MDIFTTSYHMPGMRSLLVLLTKIFDPNRVLEVGTQQGGSASIIASALSPGSFLWTCDLFQPNYSGPPYKPTHANFLLAQQNLSKFTDINIEIHKKTHNEMVTELISRDIDYIDVLHIDISNHYDNLKPVLQDFIIDEPVYVRKAIILEGCGPSWWHIQYGYKSYLPMLEEDWLKEWDHDTITFSQDNALTVLRRK